MVITPRSADTKSWGRPVLMKNRRSSSTDPQVTINTADSAGGVVDLA